MAKKAQTPHGRALAAFTTGRITKAEYQACVRGEAWIEGAFLYDFSTKLDFFGRPKMTGRYLGPVGSAT